MYSKLSLIVYIKMQELCTCGGRVAMLALSDCFGEFERWQLRMKL